MNVPLIPFHSHPDGSRHAGRSCGTCPEAQQSASGKTYCTNPEHGYGEHDASCLPPADPADPELRLLRAIFGLCGLCDTPDEHSHVPEDRP